MKSASRPILYYDPVGRNIRTLFPNGTFARVEFNPWLQKVFDANDTVKQSQWYADRGSPDPAAQPEPLNDPERRAAWLAAKHADTPGVIHFDSLGRPVYAVSDYGGGKTAAVRSESDLTGRFSKMFDQEQREVASGFVGMAGTPIVGESAEKGRRWTFQNVLGALVKTWDEHGRQFRAEYDVLHRPVSTFVQEAGQAEILFNYVVYGDRLAERRAAQSARHRASDLRPGRHGAGAGAGLQRQPQVRRSRSGQGLQERPRLERAARAADVAAIQAAADPALETAEVFTASSQYDALNRPTRVTLPDGTVIVPTYNEANFLASLQAQIRGQGNFIEFLKRPGLRRQGPAPVRALRQRGLHPLLLRPQHLPPDQSADLQVGRRPADAGAAEPELHATTRSATSPRSATTRSRPTTSTTRWSSRRACTNTTRSTSSFAPPAGNSRGLGNDTLRTHTDLDFVPQLPHPNNTDAVRTYTEEYEYDLLGNIKVLRHRFKPQPGIGNGWTRHYRYAFDDVPGNRTNRLTATSMPGDPDGGPLQRHLRLRRLRQHDPDAAPGRHGLELHGPACGGVDLGGGGTAHYVYGLGGQRLRKVIERNGNLKLEWIFLGAVMIFRRRRRDTNDASVRALDGSHQRQHRPHRAGRHQDPGR